MLVRISLTKKSSLVGVGKDFQQQHSHISTGSSACYETYVYVLIGLCVIIMRVYSVATFHRVCRLDSVTGKFSSTCIFQAWVRAGRFAVKRMLQTCEMLA